MITKEEAQERLEKSEHPRVTVDDINDKIAEARFLRDGITTICIIEMKSGFKVIGHSTPADPRNYDREIGEHYAYQNAFSQLWPLEGYLLRNKLSA